MGVRAPFACVFALAVSGCSFDVNGFAQDGDAGTGAADAASSSADAPTSPPIDAAPDAAIDATRPPPPPEMCGNVVDDDLDGLVDCADPDCGASSCDDGNVCTDDQCQLGGTCANTANAGDCGEGCVCGNSGPTEAICNDGVDNDADGAPDCRDGDCASCGFALTCCSDGSCHLICF